MLYNAKIICDKCNVRLPKNRPKLVCSICDRIRHFRCQGLSKNDAQYLIENFGNAWSCTECIREVLPINACAHVKYTPATSQAKPDKFKVKCASCDGYSYTPRNVKVCHYCDQQIHTKSNIMLL